jgi:hypothetical protein
VAESELFEKDLQARREVLGAGYVDANRADTDEFMMAFQRIFTEWVGLCMEQARSRSQDAQHPEPCDLDGA